MGTSACHLTIGDGEIDIPGMFGRVKDGMIPGYWGYEMGQASFGDTFAWYVENAVPSAYHREAEKEGRSIHAYLQNLASDLVPGQSGLLALDWFNGNRSVLLDSDLSGMLIGLTLQTKAEEIYRSLVESATFGMRIIVDTIESHGIAISEIVAAGGIANKSPFVMQLCADVLKRELKVAENPNVPARSSAIYGAVAAGSNSGGFDNISEASIQLGVPGYTTYAPDSKRSDIYDELYCKYKKLHDYFGIFESDIMKTLKSLKMKRGV
jgi:L-ribulokinase